MVDKARWVWFWAFSARESRTAHQKGSRRSMKCHEGLSIEQTYSKWCCENGSVEKHYHRDWLYHIEAYSIRVKRCCGKSLPRSRHALPLSQPISLFRTSTSKIRLLTQTQPFLSTHVRNLTWHPSIPIQIFKAQSSKYLNLLDTHSMRADYMPHSWVLVSRSYICGWTASEDSTDLFALFCTNFLPGHVNGVQAWGARK